MPSLPTPGDLSACPANFRGALQAGPHTGFVSGGQTRSFQLLLPPASATGPRPLLVAFHGTGISAVQAIQDYDLRSWAAAGFIVAAPDSNGNGKFWPVWDAFEFPGSPPADNADLALFDDLLRCLTAQLPVDRKRIYVAGQSAGGLMTNFVLGRRSPLLAGGIPASGGIDNTQTHATAIDPITVIVTWGGSNDVYTGGAGSITVANVGLAEQAALTTQYWNKQPGSLEIACKGDELGHVWLTALNAWMRDVLLAHPKGSAVIPGWALPPLPSNPRASCMIGPATYQSPITVTCAASTTAGCQQYCQLLGDCLVENGTLGPIVAPQLGALGFSSTANVCGGCEALCAQDAQGSAADATVLGCLATHGPRTACNPGFAGGAAFATVGGCCAATPGSHVCGRYCSTFGQHPLISAMLTGCR